METSPQDYIDKHRQPSMQTMEGRESLFSAMAQGALVITPNNRLSHQLLHDFLKHQRAVVKDKPRCQPYQAFLRDRFKYVRHHVPHISHPILLTMLQQRHLLRHILVQHQGNHHEGLLNEVQEAWARCQHWHVDVNHPSFAQTPQTRLFQKWHQQLQRTLDELQAITEEQLAHYLYAFPNAFHLNTVVWVSFDDYTPQQLRIQQAIAAEGCLQYGYDLSSAPTALYQYPAEDSQDELQQMILWLKEKQSLGETRIAVVVPDLQAQSSRLQRLLPRHFDAQQFNISLGHSLIEHPLVTHALHWLGLQRQNISNHQARLLLHSPYLAKAQTEFAERSEVMQNHRVLQETIIPYDSFLKAIQDQAPALALLLEQLEEYPQQASVSTWIHLFKNRLNTLGFPGEYPLNSATYQCFQRFLALLDELLALTVITPSMDRIDAWNALQDLAKSTIFQPKKTAAPIQILGLLEASGCVFDSVWVMGVTDQCLPQKTRLSAFIPLDLQRDQQMPHATPTRELQFAEQVLQRLQHGSHECIVSYPKLSGDIPHLPSPLISHLPKWTPYPPTTPPTRSFLVPSDERYLLPLTADEVVSGGTALLANQAKCPFRAFASHRLHAKPGLTIVEGLDASERGQVMHKIMDILWRQLGSQQTLLALTPSELQQHIEQAIVDALAITRAVPRASFPPLVQEIELLRFQRLVAASLEWEKQRPPFVVDAIEQEFTIHLAGIDFRVRVDRLDKSNDGKKWVIDYKSSLPAIKPWNEERPEAPQLLLYALLDDHINALLFIQLQTGRITCSGLSEHDVSIQGISPLKKGETWVARQQQWQQQLNQLAEEFQTGHCPPQPNRSSTCQHCDFPNLCRIGFPSRS